MTYDLKTHLSSLLNEAIINISSINGGDISQAYRIDTINSSYFLKLNVLDKLNMFQTEAEGLKTIAETNTIAIPKVHHVGAFENTSFLIMEWVESKQPNHTNFENLGIQLAQLHKTTAVDFFGFDSDNFIGSLHQSNNKHSNWTDFYIEERLLPQLNVAKNKGFLSSKEVPSILKMKTALQPLFINAKPSLLHGDLWSGNYHIATNGTPYIIDPAIYYGHNEVDIAMTKLFGGFSSSFYNAYFDILPPDTHTNNRIEVYQLYYLLVHLNLFGRSYYGAVNSILKAYF